MLATFSVTNGLESRISKLSCFLMTNLLGKDNLIWVVRASDMEQKRPEGMPRLNDKIKSRYFFRSEDLFRIVLVSNSDLVSTVGRIKDGNILFIRRLTTHLS